MHVTKSKRLFLKYLLSYFLVLLVPVVLINMLFSYRFLNTYRQEMFTSTAESLVYVSQTMDGELQNLSDTVSHMQLSIDFHNYDVSGNILNSRMIMNNLSAYATTNPLIDSIALYLRNEDYMIVGNSTSQVEFFLRKLYSFEHTAPNQLSHILENQNHTVYLPKQHVQTPTGPREYMMVLSPIYTDYQMIRGTCIFFIKADTIASLVEHTMGKYGASVAILDQNGQLLYSPDLFPYPPEDIPSLIQAKPFFQKTFSPDGTPYFATSYQLENSGWTYLALLPENQKYTNKLTAIVQELIAATTVALSISGILIFFFMRINYSPIKKLKDKASALSKTPAHGSELETISTTLDFLSDQNHMLTNRLQGSISSIKNARLQKLLTGLYLSREDFNLDMQDLDIQYSYDYFFAAIIQFHSKVADLEQMAFAIQAELCTSMESFCILPPEHDKMITINCIPKEQRGEIVSVMERMRQAIHSSFYLELTIGTGNLHKGTLSIPKSYLEARSSLDYRFVKGNGRVIPYDDLFSTGQPVSAYPKEYINHLKAAIHVSDTQAVTICANKTIEYIQSHNLPLFLAKGICFDMIRTFLESEAEGELWYQKQISAAALMDVDTVDDVIHMIQDLNGTLSKTMNIPQKKDSDFLLEDIICYIKDNCLRCEFSIQETAEHFHMLLPNLSQFFKDKTGQNILEYSTEYRMKQAKKLLADSSLTQKDISQQVGYYNASSFIRRFKQLYGITPGDYRKQQK